MKPLYWKLLLILGAVLVAASLVVPKALRKNAYALQDNAVHNVTQVSDKQKSDREASPLTVFTFHAEEKSDQNILRFCVQDKQCPLGVVAYPNKDGSGHMMLKANEIISSKHDLKSTSAAFHPSKGIPVLEFVLNETGERKLCTFSTNHIGEQFAVVLNNEILTAPRINGAICGGRGFLEGGFTRLEAKNLAHQLNAGIRPVKSRVID